VNLTLRVAVHVFDAIFGTQSHLQTGVRVLHAGILIRFAVFQVLSDAQIGTGIDFTGRSTRSQVNTFWGYVQSALEALQAGN
jgi:hypothetical protein